MEEEVEITIWQACHLPHPQEAWKLRAYALKKKLARANFQTLLKLLQPGL